MIIEFYGLPGAGKTTIAQKLEEKAGFKIVKIKNKKELILFNILFLLKHPLRFFVLLYYVINNSTGLKEFYYKFMNAFLTSNAKYQKAKKYKKAIIDQGYFQGILSIFNEKISLDKLNKYLNFILRPKKLFIFDLSLENMKLRTTSRGYFGRENFGKEYSEKWIETIINNNALIKKELPSISQNFLLINANQNIDEVYSKILNNLN